ncbi:anti-sigma factor domain-containing protein [Octadecabacter sp. R77987]|uniref:anti-sigma factor n=1 Tax=Octadecabacter sp. R77987 TaxID=3093874 RepID=UPI00366F9985
MTQAFEQEEGRALAAEYALGLLDSAEARAFEDALATDPDLRDEYANWATTFAAMTNDIAAVAPPASAKVAIDAVLFGKPRSVWQRIGLMPALLGATAAALILFVVVNLGLLAPAPTPTYVAEIAAEDQSLIVTAAFDETSRTLSVSRAAGSARDGRALELWLIAGENAPVSLGVLPDDPNASLTVPADLVAALNGGVLAISDEPLGGSPTGAPTGVVLAVGPLTTL